MILHLTSECVQGYFLFVWMVRQLAFTFTDLNKQTHSICALVLLHKQEDYAGTNHGSLEMSLKA